MVEQAPFDGPVTVEVDGATHAIGRSGRGAGSRYRPLDAAAGQGR